MVVGIASYNQYYISSVLNVYKQKTLIDKLTRA
ncbi:uncharacterized protein METZ01_LOCUS137171 [marine metagenome]|uniref:Uncharacterized protein n=1 Tax=marine metagenome TaxID=408172 RepID=A0A381Z6E3_9ZZZZ